MYTFKECYDSYHKQLRSFISHNVKRNDVDDISQEVWIKFFDVLGKKKEIENIQGLVYKIAKNTIIDFWRKRKLQFDDEVFMDDILDKSVASPYYDEVNILNYSLENISQRAKGIIKSKYYGCMEIKDISDLVGITPNNTRVVLHRGIKALRASLNAGTQKYKYQLL